jgi:hypothetical protein
MIFLFLACTAPKEESFPTCEITPPEGGTLVADGTLIRDSLGRQVTLRGVNAGGRSKFAPYMPFDFDDFDSAWTGRRIGASMCCGSPSPGLRWSRSRG